MVGEHDPGSADPNSRRERADVRDQQLWRAAGQAAHVVVPGSLHRLSDADGPGQRRRGALPVLDADEVQHRQRQRTGAYGCLINVHGYRQHRAAAPHSRCG